MRIGLDVRLTYYRGGGIPVYIRHLAAALPSLDRGREHVHFYRRGHAETLSRVARRVDCWTPAPPRLERLTLSAEIAPWRVDLFHAPDCIPPRWGFRRVVVTVHDLGFLRYPETLTADSRRHYAGHIRAAVGRADAVIADSRATQRDLAERLSVPADRVAVVPLGVDDVYRPLPGDETEVVLSRFGLEPGYVLFVGTFEPRKNVAGLCEAYARVRRLVSDAPALVLAGHRGWLFEATRERVERLGLGPHVRFLHDVGDGDLPALYNGAALFVLASHHEGFGLPVLEAMACGVPCVVADRGSLPEVAGGVAVEVDPDDPDAIATAIVRVLTDTPLRDDMRRRGLARAATFSWTRTARATLDVYDRVLAGQPPGVLA
jgi:glycosyltransferase involved in cell wall biosynthesis